MTDKNWNKTPLTYRGFWAAFLAIFLSFPLASNAHWHGSKHTHKLKPQATKGQASQQNAVSRRTFRFSGDH